MMNFKKSYAKLLLIIPLVLFTAACGGGGGSGGGGGDTSSTITGLWHGHWDYSSPGEVAEGVGYTFLTKMDGRIEVIECGDSTAIYFDPIGSDKYKNVSSNSGEIQATYFELVGDEIQVTADYREDVQILSKTPDNVVFGTASLKGDIGNGIIFTDQLISACASRSTRAYAGTSINFADHYITGFEAGGSYYEINFGLDIGETGIIDASTINMTLNSKEIENVYGDQVDDRLVVQSGTINVAHNSTEAFSATFDVYLENGNNITGTVDIAYPHSVH